MSWDVLVLNSWWRHQMETFSASLAFVWGIHRSPVNSPHKGQWRGALMFTLICAGINGWVNTREAGDLRRYRPHYDVIVMCSHITSPCGPDNVLLVLHYLSSHCFSIDVILPAKVASSGLLCSFELAFCLWQESDVEKRIPLVIALERYKGRVTPVTTLGRYIYHNWVSARINASGWKLEFMVR